MIFVICRSNITNWGMIGFVVFELLPGIAFYLLYYAWV